MNDNDIRSFVSRKSRIAEARLHHARKFSRRVLPPGTKREALEIVEPLAESEFDIAYLVIDHATRQYRVLKEYLPARLATRLPDHGVAAFSHAETPRFEAGRASFLAEAHVLAQHDSPYLVKPLRAWEAAGTAYVLMPCLEGIGLRQAFEEYLVIPAQEWLQAFLADLHAALMSLHKLPGFRVHLSPGRIFLPQDERPLLLGLGASRQALGEPDAGFAAPELLAGATSRPGEWTDVYSLGALAYYLIAARAPLDARARLRGETMMSAREVGKDRYSAWLLDTVDQSLSLDPAQRHASLAQFCRALKLPLPQPRAALPLVELRAPAASSTPAAQPQPQPVVAQAAMRAPAAAPPPPAPAVTARPVPVPPSLPPSPPAAMAAAPAQAAFAAPQERMPEPRRKDMRIEPTLDPVTPRPVRQTVPQPVPYRRRRSGPVWAALTVLLGTGLGAAAYFGSDRWLPMAEGPSPTVVLGKPAGTLSVTGEPDEKHDTPARQVAEARPAILPKAEPEPEEPAAAAPQPAPLPSPGKAQAESPRPVPPVAARNARAQSGASSTAAVGAGVEPTAARERNAQPAQVVALADASSAEETAWKTASVIDKPPAYEAYLRQYPAGRHAAAARGKLATSRLTESVTGGAQETGPASSASAAVADAGTPPPRALASAAQTSQPPQASQAAQPTQDPPAAPRGGADSRVIRLDGQTMTGNFAVDQKTGIISGTGRITWNNGNQFDGTLVRGVKQGKGQFTWANGQRYSGDWANDVPNGQGAMVFPNGNRYEGGMRDGKPNGKGVLVFANGNRYEGEVVDGMPQGQGMLRFQTGDVYQGDWSGGKIQGNGRYTWKSGNAWEGEFRNDRMTSNGKMIYGESSGPMQASR